MNLLKAARAKFLKVLLRNTTESKLSPKKLKY